MLGWLFLAFTLGPIVELYLLIKVGEHIGALPTIAIVLVTGAVGAALARSQGLVAFRKVQEAMNEGRMPGRELVQAMLVLAGGLLLVTPGILTDVAGLLLMVPPIRALAARGLTAWLGHRVEMHVQQMGGPGPGWPPGAGGGEGRGAPARDQTVDVEYRRGRANEAGDGAPAESGARAGGADREEAEQGPRALPGESDSE